MLNSSVGIPSSPLALFIAMLPKVHLTSQSRMSDSKWVTVPSWFSQFSSVAQSCPTLCNPMDCSTPGFPVHYQLPELTSNSCPSSQWCHPAISSSVIHLQSFPVLRVFSGESVLHIRWPKYWSLSFSISPSSEYSGLISFRVDWALSRVSFNPTVRKHQFFGPQLSL